jgi:hypothetical protein
VQLAVVREKIHLVTTVIVVVVVVVVVVVAVVVVVVAGVDDFSSPFLPWDFLPVDTGLSWC